MVCKDDECYQNLCHVWPFTKHLKNPMHWDIFRFLNIYVCWNVTTLTLTPNVFKKFMNTLFEWILHLTSMSEHIYNILGWSILKCQRRFFSTKHSIIDHGLTMNGVWLISHEFFYSLIRCSLLSECLMIGIIALLWDNKKESLT
jgi:hypothetical protein